MALRNGLFVMVFGVAALAVVGCKSGDDGTGGGGTGTGGGQQAAPVVLPPNQSGQSCANGDQGSCTDQAEIQEYSNCIVSTCDAAYKQCFGNDYMAGTFGGDCGALMDCANQCQDCDQTCLQACSDQHYTGACKGCIEGPIVDCVIDALKTQKCKIPCGPDVGGAACDDLKACCESMADEQQKSDCLTQHGSVSLGGDMVCQSTLDIYVQSGVCTE
jgi:hypothetical protein